MPVTSDKPGPYTSPKAILDIVLRHRDRGLPSPMDADTLRRAGISESLIPRTLQSLQALDLITEKGEITEVFEGLRLAPEAEFKARLKEWLDATYADVLRFVDPANDSGAAVRDAFRNYKPFGQQDRMVTLFLRLYEAAGVAAPKNEAPKPRSRPAAVRDTSRVREAVRPVREVGSQPHRVQHSGGHLPPAIAGLLQSLPAAGAGWTQDTRDRFMATFGAVLDFCVPIISEADVKADENE